MRTLARIHRHAHERRGRAALYAAICSSLGIVIGLVLTFVVVVAPVTTAAGTVVRVKEGLTRAVCNIPVGSDWVGADCDVDEDIADFIDASEASGFSALLRAAYDCSNVPEEQRQRRLCDRRSLDQAEQGAIPPERATLIPVFVDAGFKQKVPWALLAAVAGARSNFGEDNCSADRGRSGGFYRFTRKEWDKYKTDGGSMQMDRSGVCWEVPGASEAFADGKSPYELFDPKPDGRIDPRDPADAIATMGRLLAAEGARGTNNWDKYNGGDANACPVDESIDGKITPAPVAGGANPNTIALPGSEPAAGNEVGASHYGPGGTTASGLPAARLLMGFAELSKRPADLDFAALGKLEMGSVVAITHGTTTVYAAKVDVGAGGGPVQGKTRAIDLLPGLADKLGVEGLDVVSVSAPIGTVDITSGMTVAAFNAAVKKVAQENGGGVVPGGGSASTSDIVSQIKSVIKRRAPTSPLLPHVEYAVQYSLQTGLDPRFIFAISGSESTFGTTGNSASIHNAWGMGPHIVYPDWQTGFRAAIDNLNGDLYRGDGRFTIEAIGARWCPVGAANDPTGLNNNWVPNMNILYTELGGDPTRSVFIGETAPGVGANLGVGGSSGLDGPEYSGRRPTDKISKAVAVRVGESTPRTPCYVAQVHQWYEAIVNGTGGAPPAGSVPQDGTIRARIVQILEQELAAGTGEPAAYAKYADGRVEPWCADFQSWVWTQAGVDYQVSNRAYSGAPAPWAAENTILRPPTATPEPGDAVIWGAGHAPSINTSAKALAAITGQFTGHVSVVSKVHPDGTFDTIGGNESDTVLRKTRINALSTSGRAVLGFASPVKPGQDIPTTGGSGAGGGVSGDSKVVWIQAGHVAPLEPGYRAQTGAPGEAAFNEKLARAVVRKLKAANVDARYQPGMIEPVGAQGAVFLSIHHDTSAGEAAVGHAVHDPDWGENYYPGEGAAGTPRATPYPNSAPHRAGATTVSPQVETQSKALATILSGKWRGIYTRANGARARFTGVQQSSGNARMMHYYGYFRVNTRARVLLETGAGGTDRAFLNRTDLLARTISSAVREYLER